MANSDPMRLEMTPDFEQLAASFGFDETARCFVANRTSIPEAGIQTYLIGVQQPLGGGDWLKAFFFKTERTDSYDGNILDDVDTDCIVFFHNTQSDIRTNPVVYEWGLYRNNGLPDACRQVGRRAVSRMGLRSWRRLGCRR